MPGRRSRSTASRAWTSSSSRPPFGAPQLDRKDDPARVLRYQSDACTLFVSLYRRNGTPWRAEFADAYDTHLRPLPADQCAGSVAAQKQRVA